MEDKFIYFSYRYKYRDDQFSAMSPFSAVAFFPKNFNIDYGTGDNIAMVNRFDQAVLTFNTGDEQVEEIQLLFRDTRNLNIKVIETFKKSDFGWADNVDVNPEEAIFNNNKVYTVLGADQLPRLFDNVPLIAQAQDIIGGRLVYGNYTQYYDIIDENGEEIELDYNVGITTNFGDMPNITFRSDRDYEIGIAYLDEWGRSTTVLTCPTNTAYIPPANSNRGNNLRVEINHKAPYFAKYYRLLIKQSTGDYYSIFPITYYEDGIYRWFLLTEADRNKVDGKKEHFKAIGWTVAVMSGLATVGVFIYEMIKG